MQEGSGLGRLAHLPCSTGGRREAGASPGAGAESRAKATNFASYNRARQWQATAAHLPLQVLISDSKAVWR